MASIPFTSPPRIEEEFEIGEHVEVFCDHDQEKDRIRDWLEGVVVKKGAKQVAVQFDKTVYLTDGWMVPDHVLWCSIKSANIRRLRLRRRRPKEER